MNETTSGNVESSESSGSKVMKFETVMVCIIDPTKSGNQTPLCTIKRTRVLNNSSGKSDTEPSELNESPTPDEDDDQTELSGEENDQICPLPSREMTTEEEEEAAMNCLSKAYDKEFGATPDREDSNHA
jgi:hypothetical protein